MGIGSGPKRRLRLDELPTNTVTSNEGENEEKKAVGAAVIMALETRKHKLRDSELLGSTVTDIRHRYGQLISLTLEDGREYELQIVRRK